MSHDPSPANGRNVRATDAAADRAVASNSAALLGSRVLMSAMGWAGSIVAARSLAPEQWGQFSFVFGLLGLLSVVTDLGVGRVVLSQLLVDDADEVARVAGAFVALRMTLGLVGYAVAMGYVVLLNYPTAVVAATAVGGVVVVLATPSHALTVLFQSRLRLTVVALAEAVGQVLQLALTVAAALWAPGLLIFVLPFVGNEILQLIVKLRRTRRGDAGPVSMRRIEFGRWRAMLTDALPLTIGMGLASLLYKVDILLLSRLDTFDAVGLYSVSVKFADALVLVAVAVVTPVMTVLVGAWRTDMERFRATTARAATVLVALGCGAVAGFWPAAEPIIGIFYGPHFRQAAGSAQLLVVGAFLAMLTYLGFTVLVAAGQQRWYPVVGIVGLAVNVAANLVLIPAQSFRGAAVATLVTEFVVLVVIATLVGRTVRTRGLVPLGQVSGLMALTVTVVSCAALIGELLPWPVRAGGSVVAVAVGAWVLGYPGTRCSRAVPTGSGGGRG